MAEAFRLQELNGDAAELENADLATSVDPILNYGGRAANPFSQPQNLALKLVVPATIISRAER